MIANYDKIQKVIEYIPTTAESVEVIATYTQLPVNINKNNCSFILRYKNGSIANNYMVAGIITDNNIFYGLYANSFGGVSVIDSTSVVTYEDGVITNGFKNFTFAKGFQYFCYVW